MKHKLKVWDKKKKRMVGQQWFITDPEDRFVVLLLSGAKDKSGNYIGENDVVILNDRTYLISYNQERLRWEMVQFVVNTHGEKEYAAPSSFNNTVATNMQVIDNLLQQEANNGQAEHTL